MQACILAVENVLKLEALRTYNSHKPQLTDFLYCSQRKKLDCSGCKAQKRKKNQTSISEISGSTILAMAEKKLYI